MPEKHPNTVRHGGPGASHENADKPPQDKGGGPNPGEPTNSRQSRVSGGGGERDSHHTHDPEDKGGATSPAHR